MPTTNHTPQERYSDLVLAKIRAEQVLSDGFVFNNDYEGNPTAGAVKIPVRDEEVAVSDYDRANGITVTHGATSYPRFATRVAEWAVGVHVQDLAQSGNYIGACSVQGRRIYAHKVLRSIAIRAVYAPGSLDVTLAPGSTKPQKTLNRRRSMWTERYCGAPIRMCRWILEH